MEKFREMKKNVEVKEMGNETYLFNSNISIEEAENFWNGIFTEGSEYWNNFIKNE